MNRRGLQISLAGILLVAAAAFGLTVGLGRSPLLGLDLRGGVSVVLQPQGKVTPKILQQAVSIIDRRVNGLGVANSSVTQQGKNVVIELPGERNSQQVLNVIGSTAQLYFRPVICTLPGYQPAAAGRSGTSTSPGTTTPSHAKAPSGTTKSGAGRPTSAALTASTTPALSPALCSTTGTAASRLASIPSTSPNADDPKAPVLLPSSPDMGVANTRWLLGPADFSGTVVKSAAAQLNTQSNQYQVSVNLNNKGLSAFNKVAAVRYAAYVNSKQTGQQPPFSSQEAIELDGQVESAPVIEAATFPGALQISGAFTAKQASDLALQLNYGSLPVRFNPQQVQSVSAQLGSDALRAGLLAGLGGIVLVLLYMIVYYRALGLVVVLGLCVGGALLYAIITQLSYSSNLALTLAGVTGIIVSVGITVDSYVVYFERLKDEIRAGKTVRSSVERGFTRAFRTVLTADLVSLLAAVILYLLTVGDVRGFAFTLGLSTLLDIFTAYFFIRPMVVLLGRRRSGGGGSLLGVASGLGVQTAGGAS